MIKANIRDILFDADETLFDFAACEYKAFFAAAKHMNISVNDDTYKLYSKINGSLWKAHERGEITREDIQHSRFTKLAAAIGQSDAIGESWNERYEYALANTAVLFDDTVEVVTRLSKKYRLSIVTNGLVHVQRTRMSLSGIEHLFERVFISGELGYSKPDKRFFDAVADALPDFNRDNAIVVGDSLTSDIEGARRASIDSILVDRRSLHPNGCEGILARVENLFELENLLKCG